MENRLETFTSLILKINRSIQRIKSLEMDAFHLKGIHAMCLLCLSRSETGLTQAELVRLCQEDKASISRALSELNERGLVRDARAIRAKKYNARMLLTAEGEKIARQVREKAFQALDSGAEGIGERDREALYRYLKCIDGNLETYIREVKASVRNKREGENENGNEASGGFGL